MQQRYYDPVTGRFLSIDPVTTDANTGSSFNRYSYANNSPYRYIDPDGREAEQKDKRDEQIDQQLQKQTDRCQINCSTVTYQLTGSAGNRSSTYNQNDVRGGFNSQGQSLVYHPEQYDPGTASQIILMGAAMLLPELFMGRALAPVADFFAGTRYTSKVLEQMKRGDYHGFPESVRAFQDGGIRSRIIGGDGVARDMLRIPGGYRGKGGYFEFIKESDGAINHRLFQALSGK